MGISLQQYRVQIGSYANRLNSRQVITTTNRTETDPFLKQTARQTLTLFLGYCYGTLIICTLALVLNTSLYRLDTVHRTCPKTPTTDHATISPSFLSLIICFKKLRNERSKYLAGLSLMLIVICCPSIKNPGPNEENPIDLIYCNVGGLIHLSSMTSNQPIFQTKKLLDLQSYIYTYSPRIVVINETWANKHIHSNEIISDNYYTMFRKDRTKEDMEKYDKKGGGGVMILCRNDIDANITLVKEPCSLPILSILIKFRNKFKLCLSTYYRYDYSDSESRTEVESYYGKLIKKYKNLAIIGDLNLNSIRDWNLPVSSNADHSEWARTFMNLGLSSLINSPTHKDGNILDLILTNVPRCFVNTSIEKGRLVDSDHYSIDAKINPKTRNKKFVKRKKFIYSKADWEGINEDLSQIDWENLFRGKSLKTCLDTFKSRLDITLRKWTPLKSVKIGNQPPWFDEELRCALKSMHKSRKALNLDPTNSKLATELSRLKSDYTKLHEHKKASFLLGEDENLPNEPLISKRFYGHLKSASGSSRIPDTVHYYSQFRSLPEDKSQIFNKFFCDQFSEVSTYSLQPNFARSHTNDFNDLNFCPNEISGILRRIDASKAAGPDNIDGIVLKKCHLSLASPLCHLFNLSYRSGTIPAEWKSANVVPTHKKGDKANVENYRPISLTSLVMKVYEKLIRSRLHNICMQKWHHLVPTWLCS